MLAALGMTRRQVGNMLLFEALLMGAVNLAGTLVLGTGTGWLLIQGMYLLDATYMSFSFPVWGFLAYALLSILFPVLISAGCLQAFYRETLTERLRAEE